MDNDVIAQDFHLRSELDRLCFRNSIKGFVHSEFLIGVSVAILLDALEQLT